TAGRQNDRHILAMAVNQLLNEPVCHAVVTTDDDVIAGWIAAQGYQGHGVIVTVYRGYAEPHISAVSVQCAYSMGSVRRRPTWTSAAVTRRRSRVTTGERPDRREAHPRVRRIVVHGEASRRLGT